MVVALAAVLAEEPVAAQARELVVPGPEPAEVPRVERPAERDPAHRPEREAGRAAPAALESSTLSVAVRALRARAE
ncbi:hypothetical protein [Bradyrhizobium sp. STM 3557]|uniref:hypothetical protein n=1 Tax=Bradyrhizobium sp. STM 3557 TaxID=578920 RepID=UPI00388F45A0